MANFCILRIKKLHSNGNVGGAISHHLRTRQTDNANPERLKDNWTYPNDGNGSNLADLDYRVRIQNRAMKAYKANLPEKVRKNAVRAVEFMMTVSPEVMERKDFNPTKYLNACTDWARDKFGKENVFFVAYHRDEKTPHVSILLTPIDEKGKLNARSFFGGREKMSALQDDFYNKVGKSYGLERGIKGSKAKHKTIKSYYEEINRQNENMQNLAEEITKNLPEKKTLESREKHHERIKSFVLEELETVKPQVLQGVLAGQTADRYKNLQANFRQEVEISGRSLAEQWTSYLTRENLKLKENIGKVAPILREFEQLKEQEREWESEKKEWQRFAKDPEQLRQQADKIERQNRRNRSGGYER